MNNECLATFNYCQPKPILLLILIFSHWLQLFDWTNPSPTHSPAPVPTGRWFLPVIPDRVVPGILSHRVLCNVLLKWHHQLWIGNYPPPKIVLFIYYKYSCKHDFQVHLILNMTLRDAFKISMSVNSRLSAGVFEQSRKILANEDISWCHCNYLTTSTSWTIIPNFFSERMVSSQMYHPVVLFLYHC